MLEKRNVLPWLGSCALCVHTSPAFTTLRERSKRLKSVRITRTCTSVGVWSPAAATRAAVSVCRVAQTELPCAALVPHRMKKKMQKNQKMVAVSRKTAMPIIAALPFTTSAVSVKNWSSLLASMSFSTDWRTLPGM